MLCFLVLHQGVGEDKVKTYPSGNDVFTALLLALPPQAWSGIKDQSLLQEMKQLISMVSFPTLLQQEVSNQTNFKFFVFMQLKRLLKSFPSEDCLPHEAFVFYGIG